MERFEPGREILGKYRVEGVIGQGGMGVVLRAAHVELDTHVAIKVLSSVPNAEVADRFLREAKAASKLRSEFVARVTDYGRLDDGRPCMVMELLDGEDYAAILARGPLPVASAVDAALQAAAALAEAHAAGIVHRDIKPPNLFLTVRPDGSHCTKVLDFGISKVLAQTPDQAITDTGHVLGTPLYMSPEQVRSPKEIDERTDVWSLGGVLYEMLAGQPPFHADTLGVVFARILESAPGPLAERRPEVPAALAEVVLRCLEKDRERRVQSMRELAALLAPFASSEGAVAARRAGIAAAPPRGEQPPGSSPEGALAPSDTSALAETLHAAAIDSAKTSEPNVVTAATQASVPDVRPETRAPAAEAGAPAAATTTGRPRWSIPLAAAACVAAVAVVAVLGMSRDGPAREPASVGAPPKRPLAAGPTVTPAPKPLGPASPTATSAAKPLHTASATASSTAPTAPSASAEAPTASAADPTSAAVTSTAAASAATTPATAAGTASTSTAAPPATGAPAASARKPVSTTSPGGPAPPPSATSLW